MLLLSWQLVAPIGLSPFTTIHQAAVLAHRFCFSMVAGRGTHTLKDLYGNNLQCEVPRSSTGWGEGICVGFLS